MKLAATIIVPTFNRGGVLGLTLPRLLGQDFARDDYEVLVIDDGSEDGTAEALRKLDSPHLGYHRFDHAGVAAARNRGLERARGELLVFLDDDAFVGPDFLGRRVAAHAAAPGLVATGPIIEVVEIPPEVPRAHFWKGFHRIPFPGGNASVRKEYVERAGGFDESFCQYGWEDTEFARRLWRLGIRKRYDWRTPIFHYAPHRQRSFTQNLPERLALERERGAMGAHFYLKHPSFGVAWMTKTWWPILRAHRFAGRRCGMDDLLRRVMEEPDACGGLSRLERKLLIYHAQIGAGMEVLEGGRRGLEAGGGADDRRLQEPGRAAGPGSR